MRGAHLKVVRLRFADSVLCGDGSEGIGTIARSRIVYLTGLSGAGKSTLMAAVMARKQMHPGASGVDFSSYLTERLGPPSGWEEVADADFDDAVASSAEQLVRVSPEVAAGHVFALRNGTRHIVSASWEVLLPCAGVVWLCAPGQLLATRRPGVVSEERVSEDEDFAVRFLIGACRIAKTPLLVLPHEDHADLQNAVSMVETLMSLSDERQIS